MLSTQSVAVARAAVDAAPIVGTVVARSMSTQLLADKYKAIKDTEPNFLECFKVCVRGGIACQLDHCFVLLRFCD